MASGSFQAKSRSAFLREGSGSESGSPHAKSWSAFFARRICSEAGARTRNPDPAKRERDLSPGTTKIPGSGTVWIFLQKQRKVPPAYSRAGENARSLTAVGMTSFCKGNSNCATTKSPLTWTNKKRIKENTGIWPDLTRFEAQFFDNRKSDLCDAFYPKSHNSVN